LPGEHLHAETEEIALHSEQCALAGRAVAEEEHIDILRCVGGWFFLRGHAKEGQEDQ
jgi:hypothetical protein